MKTIDFLVYDCQRIFEVAFHQVEEENRLIIDYIREKCIEILDIVLES
jgi:hypothetical protein